MQLFGLRTVNWWSGSSASHLGFVSRDTTQPNLSLVFTLNLNLKFFAPPSVEQSAFMSL